MQYCGYVSTGGVSYLNRTNPEKIKEQDIVSQEHAQRLVNFIEKL